MADSTVLLAVPKEYLDRLAGLADAIEEMIRGQEGKKHLTNADLRKTLTMSDIKSIYGIGKDKWRSGVKDGTFPAPIAGFDRPKRWNSMEVEDSLGKEVA